MHACTGAGYHQHCAVCSLSQDALFQHFQLAINTEIKCKSQTQWQRRAVKHNCTQHAPSLQVMTAHALVVPALLGAYGHKEVPGLHKAQLVQVSKSGHAHAATCMWHGDTCCLGALGMSSMETFQVARWQGTHPLPERRQETLLVACDGVQIKPAAGRVVPRL